ncbi:MAG: divergent polysaccharide deacetylase family protein [Treponema sp.]|jgi:polysaccharide deacetylase 2 family uncharacterized protein YibQ|nr:divergent polysaccharide deacetylase family protein [Treponema sp.]
MVRKAPRKKRGLEDAVRAAFVAAAFICAAVLGTGGFLAIRSALSPDTALPAFNSEEAAAQKETDPPVPEHDSALLTEMEEAIQRLDEDAGIPAPERKGILVFVIDDAGNNLRELDGFLAFPGALTIAVLPALPNSVEAAKRVRAAGKEVFLHQPMEPLGAQDPGPGVIKTGMTAAEVKAALNKNLDEIGPVAGVNNHEGSKATMDKEIMRALLEGINARHIVFLDSRTIAETAGPAAAKELGLNIAQRDIFLDNEQDRDSIISMIHEGLKKSESAGIAIMIGHAWSPYLAEILTELYPVFIREGYQLSTVGAILDPGK